MDPENEQSEFAAFDTAAASEAEDNEQADAAASVDEPSSLEKIARGDAESAERRAERAAEAETDAEPDPADTLSPAVRRLVRQYDLDITGIHGTGPSGKIRVGDVIGMLGARTDASARLDAAGRTIEPEPDAASTEAAASAKPKAPSAAAPPAASHPMTTVFECDLSRVLSHRKQLRGSGVDMLVTSYAVVACAEALKAVPEAAARNGEPAAWPRFGVLIEPADGEPQSTLVDASAAAAGSLDDRLQAFDHSLRASGADDLGAAELTIHHYGLSGSLLATPLPLHAGAAASVGLGRVRRRVVLKATDGEEAPRVGAICYVSMTFAPERITLQRANRFLAKVVRVLEQWG